ncbi:MAG: hypothetical protein KDD47_27315, partial [Acidobacteria bacterium]|nr:hypothetical protein [Acidobacteriota bacterium]
MEVRAEEREKEVGLLEMEEVAIGRHLVAEQRLVLWLPEGFAEEPHNPGGVVRFLRETDRVVVAFGRQDRQPGASLIQFLEATLQALRENGALKDVATVRRLRIASRSAIEVTGTGVADGEEGTLRLLLAADPGESYFRSVFLHSAQLEGGLLDGIFLRLLRDWAPLDDVAWSPSFERLRAAMVP